MMLARIWLLLAAVVVMTACGDDDSLMVLTIDVRSYAVPAQLNLIHVETFDANDSTRLIGHNFVPENASSEVEIVLVLGTRLPRAQVITVEGYRGTSLVATAEPTAVLFETGETVRIRIDL